MGIRWKGSLKRLEKETENELMKENTKKDASSEPLKSRINNEKKRGDSDMKG